jgi:bacillithiol system protein YtxJ
LSLQHLTDGAQIEDLLQESHTRPVLIFKHSVSCGTSAQALDELADHLEQADHVGARYAIVTVQSHRAVSNALAQRLAVRHETPQTLLLVDGRVVWNASHFRVTAEAIAKAIAAHRAPTPATT